MSYCDDRPVLNALSLVEAFAGMDRLDRRMLEAAASVLERRGSSLDKLSPDAQVDLRPCLAFGDRELGHEPGILLEQQHILVLWKPPGWTVSVQKEDDAAAPQAPEEKSGQESTHLVTHAAVLAGGPSGARSRPLQDWVIQTFGREHPIAADASVAHGLVHRLDRDTSGAILWARSYAGYFRARLQFAARALRKHYACLCTGWLPLGVRCVSVALREPSAGDVTSATLPSHNGRPAHTEVLAVRHLLAPSGICASLVEVRLHTGRRHQIRAHLAHCGHPLVGDARYGGIAPSWCPRVFLHAGRIGCNAGATAFNLEVPLPPDLSSAVGGLCAASAGPRVAPLDLKAPSLELWAS
mmetsp:Transcript_38187/g.120300  ORF Transcript_38187/g.120300 Transcript_38187/m.120300 type:complete len:354 (-) Transcript_38187:58-1119(-)